MSILAHLSGINNHPNPVRQWLEIVNPELNLKLCNVAKYDALVIVCEYYDIDPPNRGDSIMDTFGRIIDDLNKAIGKS